MSLLNHLRIDIADTVPATGVISGCVIMDCAVVNNNLDVLGNISATGNLTINGDLVLNGAQCWNTTVVTGTYISVSDDTMLLVSNGTAAPITITLPPSPCVGRVVFLKDILGNANSFNTTVVAAVGTIDGLTGFVISQNYQAITLLYNGSEWNLI
jgi:hypothetical protein